MLKEYLKYKADREARIFGNSLLALSSIFQLDRPTATLYINEIKKLNPRIGDKPTNIAHWLGSQMLYSYFTEGTIKKELLDSIPTFQKIAHKVNSSYAIWGKAEFEREIALTLLIAKEYSLAEEIINSGNKYFACFKEESNTSVPPECIIIQSIAEWGQTKQLSIETAMQIENLLESVQGPNSITPKVLSSAVIGTFYFYQNKSDKFNSYFQSALELVALNQNKMWEVILLKMLASLLHLLGETRSAEQCEIYAKGLVENSGFLFEKF